MALLKDIVSHSDELLLIDKFRDYCPNGLQVEGKAEVKKIVSGVTASQYLIDKAIEAKADLLLVHHGFFWRGENAAITGAKRKRIASLINHNLSLLAYHLPLDAHETLGNNIQLSQKLGLHYEQYFGDSKPPVGILTRADKVLSRQELSQRLFDALGREPHVLHDGRSKDYQIIAICTGAAQSYFESAIESGADAFITGEVSEQTYHVALESGVDFFFCRASCN